MNITFIPILIGLVIGILDVIPMIKQKINTNYVASAFLFHLIMPSITINALTPITWWKSSCLYLVLTLPLAIIILKDNKKDALIMSVTSTIVGCLVGIIFSFL